MSLAEILENRDARPVPADSSDWPHNSFRILDLAFALLRNSEWKRLRRMVKSQALRFVPLVAMDIRQRTHEGICTRSSARFYLSAERNGEGAQTSATGGDNSSRAGFGFDAQCSTIPFAVSVAHGCFFCAVPGLVELLQQGREANSGTGLVHAVRCTWSGAGLPMRVCVPRDQGCGPVGIPSPCPPARHIRLPFVALVQPHSGLAQSNYIPAHLQPPILIFSPPISSSAPMSNAPRFIIAPLSALHAFEGP